MSPDSVGITSARLVPWRASAFAVATARGAVMARRGWWLEVTDDVGHTARGEAAPLPRFGGESRIDCDAALARWVRSARGITWPRDTAALSAAIDRCGLPPVARAAVSQALFSLVAAGDGLSLAELLCDAPRRALPVSHGLVATPDDAAAAVKSGLLALKIKVGAGSAAHSQANDALSADLARVAAIRARVGDDVALRLDANGGWSTAQLRTAWPTLRALDVQWIEEPCDLRLTASHATVIALRRAGRPLILADESCRDASTLASLAGVVDGVVIKPMLVGGVDVATGLASRAAAAGLGVVVTTAFGTAVDLAAATAVARTCATLWGCGLDGERAVVRPDQAAAIGQTACPHPVAAAARQRPDHAALRFDGATLTWRQVAMGVAARADVLRQHGVNRDDIVAVRADATAETVLWMHAITWRGAVLAPLDARAPATAVARQVAAIHPDFRLTIGAVAASADDVLDDDVLGDDMLGDDALPTPGPGVALVVTPPLASDGGPAAPWPMDAPRVRLLTSGSTGDATAVDLTAGQLLASVLGTAQRLGHDPADVWLDCLPLHHTGGLAILLRCACLATTTDLHQRFDARRVATAILRGDCAEISLVPAWLRDVLAIWPADTRPHPAFRVALIGGAALPDSVRARAAAVGLPLAESWGLTESASQVATRAPWDAAASGVGAPLCVADVSSDADGRLCVHGPLIAQGSLRTGDLGVMSPTGVVVSGRADACFQSGGELVDPRQIETALRRLPQVQTALVVGLPDDHLGERAAALVVLHPPHRGGSDSHGLRAVLRQHLRAFLIPSPLHIVDALPQTALAKPDGATAVRMLLTVRARENAEKSARQAKTSPIEAVPHDASDSDVQHSRGGSCIHRVATERAPEVSRQGSRAARRFVDTHMHVADDGARLAPGHGETKSDGGVAKPLDAHRDVEHIAEPHRRPVVSLDVDQGQRPRRAGQQLSERQTGVAEQRLEGGVGELEGATEEDDASGVDLGETNVMTMDE